MSRRWVVNASPIILLGKVRQVALLPRLADEILVAEAVAREVETKADGVQALEALRAFDNVRVVTARVASEVAVWSLGPGESGVLSLALDHLPCRVVLDDLEARRCAKSFDIPVIGTLGVVLRAKRLGLIPKARPVIEQLLRHDFYLSPTLIEMGLARVGE